MAIRSIAHLKSFFQAVPTNDRPGSTEFGDFFDTLTWFNDMSTAAAAAASPVMIVADQAARLALGPSISAGQRVKQTDNGITYIKQISPGSNVGDWEAIGDTAITIPDVVGCAAALALKLRGDTDDQATDRLGVRNLQLDPLGDWPVTLGGTNYITADPEGQGLNYAEAPGHFTLALVVPSGTVAGRSVTGLIYNPQVGAVNATLGAGMIGTNGVWPISLPAGKYMYVTFTFVRLPGDVADTTLVAATIGA